MRNIKIILIAMGLIYFVSAEAFVIHECNNNGMPLKWNTPVINMTLNLYTLEADPAIRDHQIMAVRKAVEIFNQNASQAIPT
jgi:hypothetical protein